jgi:signal transduction histidine kinase
VAKHRDFNHKDYNTRFHALANRTILCGLLAFGVFRAAAALSQGLPRAALISATAVLLVSLLIGFVGKIKRVNLTYYLPLLIYLIYMVSSYFMGSFTYYFPISGAIVVVSMLYLNKRAMLVYIVVLAVSGLVLVLLHLPLSGADRPPESIPLMEEVVDYVLLMVVAVISYLFTRFASDKNERTGRDADAFETLFATTPNVMALVDDEGLIYYASNNLALLAGLEDPKKAQGYPLSGLFEDEKVKSVIAEIIATNGYYEETHSFAYGEDGKLRYFKFVADRLKGETVGRFIDVSDVTPVMEALKEAEDARVLAEEASQAKGAFLANMSHEIRTPMNAIIGMTAIGAQTGELERKDYAFSKIEEASNHLLGVINDILDMSKIEANKLEILEAPFIFEEMLDTAADIIRFRTEEKHQRFVVEQDPTIPRRLIGDDQRLVQVIANLLSNATKFTPEKGVITLRSRLVSTNETSAVILVEVEDTGIGVTSEQKERLFEQFEQAENTTTRKYGGTGLGLAISKKLIEKMNGTLDVQSMPGKGSIFFFTIELERVEAPENEIHTSGADETGTEVDALSPGFIRTDFEGYRLLLAEDVEVNREIVYALLEDTRIAIESAENGIEAVRMFGDDPGRYDLIFMDVQMPGMDGYEATRRIRALDASEAQAVPILALTANVFSEDVAKALASGMNGHLGKPLVLPDMLAALSAHLPKRV